jgi:hypothetical protein
MARTQIEIQQPLAGLDRNYAYQSQPPFSLCDAMNVRCTDVFEQRSRLGSRPGLVKAFCQQLGGGTVESFTVEFDYTKLNSTFLRDTAPTTNFENDNLKIGVGFNSDGTVDRSILHFDLTSLPTVGVGGVTVVNIVSANLAVTKLNPPGPKLGGPAKVRRITEISAPVWLEAQATWNNKVTGTAWTTPNVKGTSSPATQTGPFTTSGEVDWSMVGDEVGRKTITGLAALVQDAHTSRSEHLHIMLMMADETIDDHNYAFRGDNYTIVADRPVLTVQYEVTTV